MQARAAAAKGWKFSVPVEEEEGDGMLKCSGKSYVQWNPPRGLYSSLVLSLCDHQLLRFGLPQGAVGCGKEVS